MCLNSRVEKDKSLRRRIQRVRCGLHPPGVRGAGSGTSYTRTRRRVGPKDVLFLPKSVFLTFKGTSLFLFTTPSFFNNVLLYVRTTTRLLTLVRDRTSSKDSRQCKRLSHRGTQ